MPSSQARWYSRGRRGDSASGVGNRNFDAAATKTPERLPIRQAHMWRQVPSRLAPLRLHHRLLSLSTYSVMEPPQDTQGSTKLHDLHDLRTQMEEGGLVAAAKYLVGSTTHHRLAMQELHSILKDMPDNAVFHKKVVSVAPGILPTYMELHTPAREQPAKSTCFTMLGLWAEGKKFTKEELWKILEMCGKAAGQTGHCTCCPVEGGRFRARCI